MWTPWWRCREGGGGDEGLTHRRGTVKWGPNECRGGREAMPYAVESNWYNNGLYLRQPRRNRRLAKSHKRRVRVDDGCMRRNRCRPNQSRSPVLSRILINTPISCDRSGGVVTPSDRGERRYIRRQSLRQIRTPSNLRYDADGIAIGGIWRDQDCKGSQSLWLVEGWRAATEDAAVARSGGSCVGRAECEN